MAIIEFKLLSLEKKGHQEMELHEKKLHGYLKT